GNPTGAVYERRTLELIAKIALERGILIISDEIYEKIIYDGVEHISIASLGADVQAQTVVVNGVSKAYAMTGWRIGYAAGPLPLIAAMGAVQKIGRASCRERVWISVVAGALKEERERRSVRD